jgi:hypothetical protein
MLLTTRPPKLAKNLANFRTCHDGIMTKTPNGLGTRGRSFWRQAQRGYDFTASELELLTEVCRCLDELEEMAVSGAAARDRATVPRPKRRGADPAAGLLTLEAECAAAAAGGDKRAVALLAQVRSWLAMLRQAGSDEQIAELFGIFAAEGRSRLDEWWANPA